MLTFRPRLSAVSAKTLSQQRRRRVRDLARAPGLAKMPPKKNSNRSRLRQATLKVPEEIRIALTEQLLAFQASDAEGERVALCRRPRVGVR